MNKIRGRAFLALKSFLLLFAVLVVLLFIIVPVLSSRVLTLEHFPRSLGKVLRFLESCQSFLMHMFVYMYVAFLGSCFASFLNVVAWRVPRGRSILGSSHCPNCNHRLSMKDNVPVWGWLKNEGSCRHCQTPIAVRYLLVELLLGVIFLALFIPEITFGGINLPAAPKLAHTGIEFVLFGGNVPLLSTFALHATLMAVLFTFAAIALERHRIPSSVVAVAALFLIGIGGCFPEAIQVVWNQQLFGKNTAASILSNALMTMGIGSAVGIFVGHAIKKFQASPNASHASDNIDNNLTIGFFVVGLAVGWQSVILVGILFIAIQYTVRILVKSDSRSLGDSRSSGGAVWDVAALDVAVLMFTTFAFLLTWSLFFKVL